jgi:nucleotide-binding universal stress UspA family protein
MYRYILVPLDGSKTAERGLREAIRFADAQKSKGKLHLVHVIDEFPTLVELSSMNSFELSIQRLRDDGHALLERAARTAAEADVEADTALCEVTQGRIADALVDEARKSGCDLIVMGTHGRRGFSRLALGSDADLVVRASTVPVLLVRDTTADT